MSDPGSPDFYRARAAEMRAKAEKAQTTALGASYRTLAENWERLADEAQQVVATSFHPRKN